MEPPILSVRLISAVAALAVCGILFSSGAEAKQAAGGSEATAKSGEASERSGVETRRRPRIRHGGLTIGGGYSHYSGRYPYDGYPYGYGYYDPFFPLFYHPAYFGGFARGPEMGKVKLNAAEKRAQVYIDDGYAGTVGELKSIWLEPGAYNLELRDEDGQTFKRRIYVLTGKTVQVTPDFSAQDGARDAWPPKQEQP